MATALSSSKCGRPSMANGRIPVARGDTGLPAGAIDGLEQPPSDCNDVDDALVNKERPVSFKASPRTEGSRRSNLHRTVSLFNTPKLIPDTSSVMSAGENTEVHFDEDLREWVWEVSEHFHAKIFVIELVGQSAYSLFGPLSWPLLMLLYGGSPGLVNRSFLPRPGDGCGGQLPFILGALFWLGFGAALFCWFVYNPQDITRVELKFVGMMLVMRTLTVSFKYAFMTTRRWRELNQKVMDPAYLGSLLLISGWARVNEKQMLKYAEMSFIGILGSRYQRDSCFLKFVPWPRSRDDLTDLRHRLDGTTKSLYHLPVGKILRAGTPFRKAATVVNMFSGESDLHQWCKLNLQIAMGKEKEEDHVDPEKTHCKQLVMAQNNKAMPIKDQDAALFEQAMHGEHVSLHDLFLYMLRSVLRAEDSYVNDTYFRMGCMLLSILLLLLPGFFRVATGHNFFGDSWPTTLMIVGPWPLTLIGFWGNNLFIYIAAKDMWRRRSLLRSCAAMLTFARRYREHCPAEVDCLPVVDLHDAHTIEGWRKLRQLCRDYGQYFYWRIKAFTSAFLICVVLSLGDFIAGLTVPSLTEARNVKLLDFFMTLIPAGTVLACIVIQVVLGHEVNTSADRHTFLLHRQKTVLMSAKQRHASDAMAREEDIPESDEPLQRAIDFIDVLCDDIDAEHKADPVKLVGMYCGYSLLSALYFIPLGTLSQIISFCGAEATSHRCLELM
mmetsp:Transcript_18997/g.44329  ORF Transcript_18997/g.44329 Transcript_18997/m.44329 type:complete len:722 (-) Transcript_18997:128-2293(-)